MKKQITQRIKHRYSKISEKRGHNCKKSRQLQYYSLQYNTFNKNQNVLLLSGFFFICPLLSPRVPADLAKKSKTRKAKRKKQKKTTKRKK